MCTIRDALLETPSCCIGGHKVLVEWGGSQLGAVARADTMRYLQASRGTPYSSRPVKFERGLAYIHNFVGDIHERQLDGRQMWGDPDR